jgi:DNA-directed RNA polymerase subunit alpha
VSSAGKTLRELLGLFADIGEGVGLELGDVRPSRPARPTSSSRSRRSTCPSVPATACVALRSRRSASWCSAPADDLLNITNFGQKSLEEVAAKLDELGLSLADGG